MARGAASQAMNIKALWRGLVRCLAVSIVARFGACFAVPKFPSRPQTRAVTTPGPLKKFSISCADDRGLRPLWLYQALDGYHSARRSPDAASVKKKFQSSLKRLSKLGVKRCNFPEWDQYMVAKRYSLSWVGFSMSRARQGKRPCYTGRQRVDGSVPSCSWRRYLPGRSGVYKKRDGFFP